MAQNLKQLGQLRPADLNSVSIYSPAASTETIVKTIVVANTSGSKAEYRIFHDDDGTTYDESTALFWDIEVASDTTHAIEINIMMNDSTGNLAIRTDTIDAITFTCYGSEVTP